MRLNKKIILNFSNSIDLLGLNSLLLHNLKHKITQRFLYKFEQFFFSYMRQAVFKSSDYKEFRNLIKNFKRNKLRKTKEKQKDKFLKIDKKKLRKKFDWFYNNKFFKKFDFYFSKTLKEKYFSSLIFWKFNSSSPSYCFNLSKTEYNLRKFSKFHWNFSNLFFLSKFLNKRSKTAFKFKTFNKSKSLKILFSIEKRKNISKNNNKFLLKDLNRSNILLIKKFFGFVKYNQFLKYLKNIQFKNKIFNLDLLLSLECRLEFCLYRLNFVSSVYFSRQYIRSKKILVNFKIEQNCFYVLNFGDLISLEASIFLYQFFFLKYFLLLRLFPNFVPSYFEIDYRLLAAIFIKKPKIFDIQNPYMMKILSLNYK